MRPLLLAAAFAGALIAHPATARSIAVPTGDIDLTSADGRALLDARIGGAARRVCAPDDIRSLDQLAAAQICMRQAIATTRPQLAQIAAARSQQRG